MPRDLLRRVRGCLIGLRAPRPTPNQGPDTMFYLTIKALSAVAALIVIVPLYTCKLFLDLCGKPVNVKASEPAVDALALAESINASAAVMESFRTSPDPRYRAIYASVMDEYYP